MCFNFGRCVGFMGLGVCKIGWLVIVVVDSDCVFGGLILWGDFDFSWIVLLNWLGVFFIVGDFWGFGFWIGISFWGIGLGIGDFVVVKFCFKVVLLVDVGVIDLESWDKVIEFLVVGWRDFVVGVGKLEIGLSFFVWCCCCCCCFKWVLFNLIKEGVLWCCFLWCCFWWFCLSWMGFCGWVEFGVVLGIWFNERFIVDLMLFEFIWLFILVVGKFNFVLFFGIIIVGWLIVVIGFFCFDVFGCWFCCFVGLVFFGDEGVEFDFWYDDCFDFLFVFIEILIRIVFCMVLLFDGWLM